MCELREVGEVGRRARCGGGVVDRALGLLCVDTVGDEPGEDASTAGRLSANRFRMFSSSDGVLISTSLRSEDKNEGASTADLGDRAFDAGTDADADADADAADDALPLRSGLVGSDGASVWVVIRRVRGRLSFLSGSGALSTGEAVAERDLRFRPPGLVVWDSLARSRAPQALRSALLCGVTVSAVLWGRPWLAWLLAGCWIRPFGMFWAKDVLGSEPTGDVEALLPAAVLALLDLAQLARPLVLLEQGVVAVVGVEVEIERVPDAVGDLAPGALPLVGARPSACAAHASLRARGRRRGAGDGGGRPGLLRLAGPARPASRRRGARHTPCRTRSRGGTPSSPMQKVW